MRRKVGGENKGRNSRTSRRGRGRHVNVPRWLGSTPLSTFSSLLQCCLLLSLVVFLPNFPPKVFFVDTPPSCGSFVEGTTIASGWLPPWFIGPNEMEESDVAGEVAVCGRVLIIG